MAAWELKAGDSLFCFSGEKVKFDSVYKFKTDTATAVYNLEASGNHNYYVSASKVLVHNCNFKSVEEVIKNAGKLERVKAGLQGFVKGNGKEIYNSLIKDAKHLKGTYYKLNDGTIVGYHTSSTTGVFTLDINKAGKIYKIRIE